MLATMRRSPCATAPLAVSLMLLAACKEEPTFEERYEKAQKTISTRAAELDRALAEAERTQAEGQDPDPQAPAPESGTR